MSFDVYQMVTDKIVELMEQGIIPWTQPWASALDYAWSGATGKPYSFVNQMLLLDPTKGKTFSEMRENARGEWVTFKEAQERGGCVRKGEHGRRVVFFKPIKAKAKDGEEEDEGRTIPLLVSYTVFHISQCDGVEQKHHRDGEITYEFSPIEQAEKVTADYLGREGVCLRHVKGDRAYYSVDKDAVTMPMPEQFVSPAEYYSTLFHEFTHSTGHQKRLDRKLAGFLENKESYSTEELVAEIGSASILATLGIDTEGTLRNSAGYIQNWLKALKNDRRMIVVASSRAEKAVRLILGVEA